MRTSDSDSPSRYLMDRFEAIQRFEDFLQSNPVMPPVAARSWYHKGMLHRFTEYHAGHKILEQCRILEKTVPLDDNYWLVGKGSFS